jgi:hypothetical protein
MLSEYVKLITKFKRKQSIKSTKWSARHQSHIRVGDDVEGNKSMVARERKEKAGEIRDKEH